MHHFMHESQRTRAGRRRQFPDHEVHTTYRDLNVTLQLVFLHSVPVPEIDTTCNNAIITYA